MAYVWIAMSDEAYENNAIYGITRTAEGAKAVIEEHVAERDAETTRIYPGHPPPPAVSFDWKPLWGEEGWSVMGRHLFYKVERHLVLER